MAHPFSHINMLIALKRSVLFLFNTRNTCTRLTIKLLRQDYRYHNNVIVLRVYAFAGFMLTYKHFVSYDNSQLLIYLHRAKIRMV